MEQLVQNLKDGHMQWLEVPFPVLSSGQVLVRNHYSLISAGTEGKTVKDARLGYIGKARARKEEVKKVLHTARSIGIKETYRLVMNKLDAPSALGYSCAGEIIGMADDVTEFRIGDLVACGGSSAVHAEVIAVPVNLCVRIDAGVSMKSAAFTTVAAIAMQGLRQADLRLGENCVVIGLGLVGQLTLQLLRASGVRAAGIDLDPQQVELAKKNGFAYCFQRNQEQLESAISHWTNGYGTDAVIITAATSSLDPIELAGSLCRPKGKVIIVGAVPTGFSRKNYYIKELDLRMSCSYGPGRYDTEYEEKGIDYPYSYVRWTENRNMQAFASLLGERKMDISGLITHTFPYRDAKKAYDLILNRSEPFAGIVLEYDVKKTLRETVLSASVSDSAQKVSVGMIGAGNFGQNFLLPALQNRAKLQGIVTARPNNAKNVADKYGFAYCSPDAQSVLKDKDINTIFIATRHNTHAKYVLEAIEQKKNVFTEKPLCMTMNELEQIAGAYRKQPCRVMVGFNRRFAPMVSVLKKNLSETIPSSIMMRINAGIVPKEHWIHDPQTGGGRLIGEACHFIDLAAFLCGSLISDVSAFAMDDEHGHMDTLSISLRHKNGSISSISYFSNGNKETGKEYIEVFNGGLIARIDDFNELTLITSKGVKKNKGHMDKGHRHEINAFTESIEKGLPCPIPFESIYNSTWATLKCLESIQSGRSSESN